LGKKKTQSSRSPDILDRFAQKKATRVGKETTRPDLADDHVLRGVKRTALRKAH